MGANELKIALSTEHGVTTFLLPLVAVDVAIFPRFRYSYRVYDNTKDKSLVVAVCKTGKDLEAVEKAKSIPGYVSHKQVPTDRNLTAFSYEVPSVWEEDFKALLDFRPDRLSKDYLNLIKNIYAPEISVRLLSVLKA